MIFDSEVGQVAGKRHDSAEEGGIGGVDIRKVGCVRQVGRVKVDCLPLVHKILEANTSVSDE
eukprot:2095397-Prymnesium_polylepis.3